MKKFKKGQQFQLENGRIYTIVKKSTLDYYYWVYFNDSAINQYNGKPCEILYMPCDSDKKIN